VYDPPGRSRYAGLAGKHLVQTTKLFHDERNRQVSGENFTTHSAACPFNGLKDQPQAKLHLPA